MSEGYNFTKFKDVGSRVGNYFISFNKSGFMVSSGFYLKEKISSFSKAVLYFDEQKKSVGIQFSMDSEAEGAFALTHGNKGTTGSIGARSFIFANNLNKIEYYGRKIPKKIDYQGNQIFVIDLAEKEGQNKNIEQNDRV